MNEDVASKSSSCPVGTFDKCVEMRKGDSLFQVLKAEKEKQDIHHRERIEQLLDKQNRELQDIGEPQGGATWPRHRQLRDTHLREAQTQQKSGNVTVNILRYLELTLVFPPVYLSIPQNTNTPVGSSGLEPESLPSPSLSTSWLCGLGIT